MFVAAFVRRLWETGVVRVSVGVGVVVGRVTWAGASCGGVFRCYPVQDYNGEENWHVLAF